MGKPHIHSKREELGMLYRVWWILGSVTFMWIRLGLMSLRTGVYFGNLKSE